MHQRHELTDILYIFRVIGNGNETRWNIDFRTAK